MPSSTYMLDTVPHSPGQCNMYVSINVIYIKYAIKCNQKAVDFLGKVKDAMCMTEIGSAQLKNLIPFSDKDISIIKNLV